MYEKLIRSFGTNTETPNPKNFVQILYESKIRLGKSYETAEMSVPGHCCWRQKRLLSVVLEV
jgi:hypothetical protein